MKKSIRVGDTIVVNGRTEKVTAVNENTINCGLTISVPVDEVVTPLLTEKTFESNGFESGVINNERTFMLKGDNAMVCAIKKEKFFDVTIKNKVFVFNGPIDDFNEFLHALDVCAISNNFVCE